MVYLSCLVDDPVEGQWKDRFYHAKKEVKKKWDGPWDSWVQEAARESVHRDANGVPRAKNSGLRPDWAARVFEKCGEVTSPPKNLSSACGSKRKVDAVSQ